MQDRAVKEKLAFVAKSFFIPIFFVAIGFLIDPLDFAHSVVDNFPVVSAILIALIAGKWIAAEGTGRAFGYSTAARRTMWSLTLPQVAATLAATLVAFRTVDPAGRHLLDHPDAQCGSRHGADDVDPRAAPDPALRGAPARRGVRGAD